MNAQIFEMIQARSAEWAALLQDLIRIQSVYEREHTAVEFVSARLNNIGVEVKLIPMDSMKLRHLPDAVPPFSAVQSRQNVIARIPGHGGGRSLIFNCHLDVQPEGDPNEWRYPPYSGDIDQTTNIIYGRGAMDDKAGVAIALGLIQVISEAKYRFGGDLIFQFVLEDEITGNGSLACLDAGYLADAAIIIDGTRPNRAINQHAGNLEFNIRQRGRAASVSVSHLGRNAIELLANTIAQLRTEVHRLNADRRPPWSEFPSPFQFVVHSIFSDAARFSIPVDATARCFLTFTPPMNLDDMRSYIERICREFAAENNFPEAPEIHWNGFASEPVMSPNSEIETMLATIASNHRVSDFCIGPSTGTSDLRHFVKRKIPCLLYGPGRGYNPHRPDEHYMLEDLSLMISIFFDFAEAWCGRHVSE